MQERWPVASLTDETAVVTEDGNHAPSPSGPAKLAVAVGIVAAVVLADQLTKWWAVDRLASGPVHVFWRLDFSLSVNTGSAFSLFQGATAALVVVAVALVAVLLVMVWRAPTFGRAAILGLILGGALGNLHDRVAYGSVIDFIEVHIFSYHWPDFNIADSAVVTGACLLFLDSLLPKKETQARQSE